MFLRYSVGDGKTLQVLLSRDSEKSILQITSVLLALILKQQYPLTAALHLKQLNLYINDRLISCSRQEIQRWCFQLKKNRILSEEAALKKGTNALTKYVWGPFGSDSLTHPN